VIIYQSVDGKVKIDVTMQGETLWLSQTQISQLFGRDKSVINRHINNILRDGELDEKVVVANFAITTQHGAMAGRTQEHDVMHYSLDMILAVGYRVKSPRGTQFRQWATQILHEYLQKGFALNDEILKNMVNAFFDMAELKASRQEPMYMRDWLETLDTFTRNFGFGVLNSGGSVTHIEAVEKAHLEYEAYKKQLPDDLSDVERAYLDTLRDMQKRLTDGGARV
jgi:hypothetical protein